MEKYYRIEKATNYYPDDKGLTFEVRVEDGTRARVKLIPWAPDVINVKLQFDGEPSSGRISSVSESSPWSAEPSFTFEELKDKLVIHAGEIDVHITLDPWRLCFYEPGSGKLITAQQADDLDATGGLRCNPFGISRDERGQICRVHESLLIRPDEAFYGFGEKFTALNKRGQKLTMWNKDALGVGTEGSYKNVPFFLSTYGYGFFLDSTAKSQFSMGADSLFSCEISVPESTLDYYLIYGPSFKKILRRYANLTGRAPVPPKWSFGIWMSNGFKEAGQAAVLEQARAIDDNQLPADLIHLDCYWMKSGEWCNFEWDELSFPDPAAMIYELKSRGFKICLWINPYISVDTEMYREGSEKGYFVKRPGGKLDYLADLWHGLQPLQAIVDFTNPLAREWYQKKCRQIVEMGVDALKTDFGEDIPEDAVFYDGTTGKEMHNRYAVLYQECVFEAVGSVEGHEGLIWARAGFTGSQRYPVHWSGDPKTTFSDMASVLRGGLSLGLSGVPFWSHDIGGFTGTPSPDLYVRWAQLGLLSSHSRCHGTTSRDPWNFGEEALSIFRQYARLRYRLLPYIYSYAYQAHAEGLPIVRAMVLEFQDDPGVYNLDLQYMFGSEMLVAPVFRPDGKTTVYLPEGKWVDYWNGQVVPGGRTLSRVVELSKLPVYVRMDSIIPSIEGATRVPQGQFEPLILDVYLEKRARFRLFDGQVYDFDCSYRDDDPTRNVVMISTGGWTGRILVRLRNYRRGGEVPVRVVVNGSPLAQTPQVSPGDTGWAFHGDVVTVGCDFRGGEIAVEYPGVRRLGGEARL